MIHILKKLKEKMNSHSIRISEMGCRNLRLNKLSSSFLSSGNFVKFSITGSFYQKQLHLLPLKLKKEAKNQRVEKPKHPTPNLPPH